MTSFISNLLCCVWIKDRMNIKRMKEGRNNSWLTDLFTCIRDPKGKVQCKCAVSNHSLIQRAIQLGLFTCLFLIQPPQEAKLRNMCYCFPHVSLTTTRAHWSPLHTFVSSHFSRDLHMSSLTCKKIAKYLQPIYIR